MDRTKEQRDFIVRLRKLISTDVTHEPSEFDPWQELDPESAAAVGARCASAAGDWAWCDVTVTGDFMGLTASRSLACCSHGSMADFMESSDYDLLLDEICESIFDVMIAIHNTLVREEVVR